MLALSKKQLAASVHHSTIVPRPRAKSRVAHYCGSMGFVKVVMKIMLLLVVAAAIAGVVALVKKPAASDVSFENWPDVARKTAV